MYRVQMEIVLGSLLLATGPASANPAKTQQPVIESQGNPNLIDFMSLQGKRPDLRVAITQKGLNAAFSEWLRSERPIAYRALVAGSPGSHRSVCSSCECCGALHEQSPPK